MENKEKYYSINFSGNAREYLDLESAQRARGLIVVVESSIPFKNTAFGQTFNNVQFVYKFLQDGELRDFVEIGSCKILTTLAYRTNRSLYNKDDIEVTFADANGMLIEPKECFGIRINGIENAVKYILDIASIGDYEKFIFHKENLQLKDRIAQLESRLGEIT